VFKIKQSETVQSYLVSCFRI